MFSSRSSSFRGRALRALSLTSALALAACGGGGGAPADEPQSTQLQITKENQQEVATEAGSIVTSMNPLVALLTASQLVQVPMSAGAPTVMATMKSGSPADLAKAAPESVLANAVSRLLPAGGTTLKAAAAADEGETVEVDCISGTGTINRVLPDPEAEVRRERMTLDFAECKLDYDGTRVVVDGKMEVAVTEGGDGPLGLIKLTATSYSLSAEGFKTLVDGDMRIELALAEGSESTVSGTRFTMTTGGTPPWLSAPEAAAAATAKLELRTVTLRDYRETMQMTDGGLRMDASASVETHGFGEPATYELATTRTLVYAEGLFTAGRIQVVGADGTVLRTSALGDGTFKLERDDNGDGSIDDTVSPVTAEELQLMVTGIFLP